MTIGCLVISGGIAFFAFAGNDEQSGAAKALGGIAIVVGLLILIVDFAGRLS
jgi:hypothetical protein